MAKVAKTVKVSENSYPHRIHRSTRIKNYTEPRKIRLRWKKQREDILEADAAEQIHDPTFRG